MINLNHVSLSHQNYKAKLRASPIFNENAVEILAFWLEEEENFVDINWFRLPKQLRVSPSFPRVFSMLFV